MSQALQKPKVLVFDDDQIFYAQCQDELRRRGMEVAKSEAHAKDADFMQIALYSPDVIITDLYIGKLDSVQFITEVRRRVERKNLHFIVLASYNNRNLFQECCEAGVDYCMIRPIDFPVLSERINKLCGQIPKNASVQSTVQTTPLEPGDLETQVTQILYQLGIPAHIRGYTYLRYGIIVAIQDAEKINSVTKTLYPDIAHQFGTTGSRVERAIRHAIEVAWDRKDVEAPRAFFGYNTQNIPIRPSNSEFIATIADSLRIRNRRLESVL